MTALLSTTAQGEESVAPPSRRPTVTWWTWSGFLLVVALYAVLAWQRRWMSDDGLIVLRTVRQILAGNGPVFNAGERVGSNTSTVWTAVLTLLGWVPGVSLEWVAVITGLVFAVVGLVLGLDAARRLHGTDPPGLLVPAGALVVCVLPPFQDFATSGLETGLITFWLAGTWWLLVRRAAGWASRRTWLIAGAIGLGPLVRPDLALFSLVGFAALLVICWPGWRSALGWLTAAGALPVAYQVFRMGYYGLIIPNTALAKEASQARWANGWQYLTDLFQPYLLWLALALLALALLAGLRAVPAPGRTVVLVAAPVVAGLLQALYVVRVGGDFMHGRMLLPAVLLLLLPVMAVPLTRWTAVPVLAVAAWAVVAAGWLRPTYPDRLPLDPDTGVADERLYYLALYRHPHPIMADDHARLIDLRAVSAGLQEGPQSVVVPEPRHGAHGWHAYPAAGYSAVYVYNLGAMGMEVPLDVRVYDPIGLASPLAAHSERIPGERIGHDKYLGYGFELAAAGVIELPPGSPVPLAEWAAALRTAHCPDIRELLDSVREPLTAGRFWTNLAGAPRRRP